MSFTVDTSGLDRLMWRVNRLTTLDMTPLMMTWQNIIIKDNRRGVLAGLDKDGLPLKPVTYRPIGKAKRLTLAQKNTDNSKQRKGVFGGFGPLAAGLHNNLTSKEYQGLGGPPLAPRREFSRVITNLKSAYAEGAPGDARWAAACAWVGVVSARQVEFLPYHFNGTGGLPVRDLRGVRPQGMLEARRAMVAFFSDAIRSADSFTFTAA